MESRRLRRSLYVVKDVEEGETVTGENLRAIRPGMGISPAQYQNLLGKTFNRKLKKGTPMSSEFVG
jgi:sialic acid synthase SpsE